MLGAIPLVPLVFCLIDIFLPRTTKIVNVLYSASGRTLVVDKQCCCMQ